MQSNENEAPTDKQRQQQQQSRLDEIIQPYICIKK